MLNPIILRTFLGVVKYKNFTKTATILGMTQPGVSQHIKQLELELGIKLIARSQKDIELTVAGEKLKNIAEKWYLEFQQLKESVLEDNPHYGVCRLASPGSFGIKAYSKLLTLQKKYPHLVIHYEYRPNDIIIENIHQDKLDLGFITKMVNKDPGLSSRIVGKEKLCLLVPAKVKKVNFQTLQKLGFIGHPDGNHHASRLLQQNFPSEFRSMDQFAIKGFINQITRIPEPVALGLGFTALPEMAAKDFSPQNKIKIIYLEKEVIDPIVCIWKKNRPLASRLQFILQELGQ